MKRLTIKIYELALPAAREINKSSPLGSVNQRILKLMGHFQEICRAFARMNIEVFERTRLSLSVLVSCVNHNWAWLQRHRQELSCPV
jgi:hypothetical protein